MKLLKRNLTKFEYAPNLGNMEILDEGRHTGRYGVVYGGCVPHEGNISTASGYISKELFGFVTGYTHVLLMEDPDADIKEGGKVLWKGDEYEIMRVAPSYNVLSVALKKMTVNSLAVSP